jgi:hypothetical protein
MSGCAAGGHGLILATGNVRHFDDIPGLKLKLSKDDCSKVCISTADGAENADRLI